MMMAKLTKGEIALMPQIRHSKYFILLLLSIVGLIFYTSAPAFAQSISNNFLEPIIDQYADHTSAWGGPLQRFAMSIFWLLVLIDVVWTGMELIIHKSDLGEWAITVAKQLLTIGFFYALLTHSSEWANALIQSFRLAGDAASSAASGRTGLQPSDIFDSGVNIAVTCIKSFKIEKPIDSLAMAFGAVIMLISFALIAALQVVALVESYIFTYASILFLGFGGSRFTRDFAQRYLVGIVAVGAKLFVIQLIIGLAVVLVKQWDADIDANQAILDIGLVLRIAGGSIVFLALAKMIPSMVQGMINGASYSSATTMVNTTMAGANVGASAFNGFGALATAGLGGLSSLVGQQGWAEGLYNASGGMANRASSHAGDAFSHSFDANAGSLGQYMPGSFTPGKLDEMTPAFRGDEPGEDMPSGKLEERNTIGV